MPNIAEYVNKEELNPSDRGINAAVDAARVYANAGREVGSSLHEIGDQIERHMAIMETSELYKTGTELKMNLQTKYEKESALPENRGNPHFVDQFMAETTPLIDAWGKGVKTDVGKQLAATMGASIRNEVFNHAAAGQSEMDAAHVQDNATQTMNSLGSGLITDPSEGNLTKTLGTAKDAIQGMTMAIPDVSTRESVASELTARYLPQLVAARYNGVAESIKNQIAVTGDDTSPALEQLNKDVKAQLGFQYLSPETQTKISELGADAVRQGQELFNSKNATAKSKLTEEAKADYAVLNTVMTDLAVKGQGATPELIEARDAFVAKYKTVASPEIASLNDFILRGHDRAQNNAVQPYNQSTRDSIQAGFSLPSDDPRRPTLASLTKAYSHGLITREDFGNDTEILNKLDKPETDPTFKPAWENFTRWQSQMIQSIGTQNKIGAGPARAQFLHDSTAAFMVQGKGGGGWDRALDNITNAQKQHSFVHAVKFYDDAASKESSAAQWLQQHDQYNPHGFPAYGSKAAPVYPTNHTPVKGAPAPTPAADLKKADEILWGKK